MSSMNFTGSSRRRNINLSGRSTSLGQNNKKFLLQIEKERGARSTQKQIRNAAVTIQSAIRKYNALEEAKEEMFSSWILRTKKIPFGDSEQYRRALAEFSFFFPRPAFQGTNQLDLVGPILEFFSTQTTDRVPWKTLSDFSWSIVSFCESIGRGDQRATSCHSINAIYELYELAREQASIIDNFDQSYTVLVSPLTKLASLITDGAIDVPDPNLVDTCFRLSGFNPEEVMVMLSKGGLSLERCELEFKGKYANQALLNIQSWISDNLDTVCDRISSNTAEGFLRFISNVTSPLVHTPPLYNWRLNPTTFLRSVSVHLRMRSMDWSSSDDDRAEADALVIHVTSRNFLTEVLTIIDATEHGVRKVAIPFFGALLQIEYPQNEHAKSRDLYRDDNRTTSRQQMMAFIICHLLKRGLVHEVFNLVSSDERLNQADFGSRGSSFDSKLFNFNHELWQALLFLQKLYANLLSSGIDGIFLKSEWLSKEHFCDLLKIELRLGKIFVQAGFFDPSYEGNDFKYLPDQQPKFAALADQTIELLRTAHSMNIVKEDFWTSGTLKLQPRNFLSFFRQISDSTQLRAELIGLMSEPASRSEATLFSLLMTLPFLFPFEKRVEMFQLLIDDSRGYETEKYHLEMRRDHALTRATMELANATSKDLKKPFSVKFVDQFGQEEAGIDGGGLTKELLTSLFKDSLDPEHGLPGVWARTKQDQLYPLPEYYLRCKMGQGNNLCSFIGLGSTSIEEFYPALFLTLGKLVGKCLRESILLDAPFAPFFLKKLLQSSHNPGKETVMFSDLRYYDEELYSNLQKMLTMSDEQIEELDMTFSITEKVPEWGSNETTWPWPPPDFLVEHDLSKLKLAASTVSVDLCPNGRKVRVTGANKYQFAFAMAKFKLDTSIRELSTCFTKGLFEAIPQAYLSLFDPNELQVLIAGAEKEMNIDDFKKNVEFGGYTEYDQTIKDLFSILENDFTKEDTRNFLRFVTSNPKAPLFGFKDLYPKFGIRNSGRDIKRLPTSSTCVNLLKLPDYRDRELLKQKLLYSIHSGAGFDLS
ncbi:unnamed protein product [Kuraishia capsulata CBS 1993]|uniref:HECT-type E3 ubiquitin transferase n=1 Tax=Kuraishia capsulata CBS 1993 TaxID=1382522 RepID=W6MKH9_9ASCO|nr:uncharacterized protein KUCA_T00002465001 [Kuraishia capsulata CBS 1993]CDK26493.1 unnamed protein product [Kuraishia capsulata CBS 1993]